MVAFSRELLKEQKRPFVAIQVSSRNAPAVLASIKSDPKLLDPRIPMQGAAFTGAGR